MIVVILVFGYIACWAAAYAMLAISTDANTSMEHLTCSFLGMLWPVLVVGFALYVVALYITFILKSLRRQPQSSGNRRKYVAKKKVV